MVCEWLILTDYHDGELHALHLVPPASRNRHFWRFLGGNGAKVDLLYGKVAGERGERKAGLPKIAGLMRFVNRLCPL